MSLMKTSGEMNREEKGKNKSFKEYYLTEPSSVHLFICWLGYTGNERTIGKANPMMEKKNPALKSSSTQIDGFSAVDIYTICILLIH